MKQIKSVLKRTVILVAVLGMVGTFLGCNTTRGIGRDVERAGEEIQDATR